MKTRERYAKVEDVWKSWAAARGVTIRLERGHWIGLPLLEDLEAIRAVKALLRSEGFKVARLDFRIGTGNRLTWGRRGEWTINPANGWSQIVHLIAHWIHRTRRPDVRPHHRTHVTLEHRLARIVVERGWLDGTLRKRVAPKPDPTVEQLVVARLTRQQARLKRWETKERRAKTAIRKLRRSIKASQRRLEAIAAATGGSDE